MTSLIDLLDAMDASSEDLEPDNEDCCAASDDDPLWQLSDAFPGDVDDSEESQAHRKDIDRDGFSETQEQWIGRRLDSPWTAVTIRRRIKATDGA